MRITYGERDGLMAVSRSSSSLLRFIDRRLPSHAGLFLTWRGVLYCPHEPTEAIWRHELVHHRQQCRLGLALFLATYALVPLPVFFAWGRWRLEREAYLENIRHDGHRVDDVVELLAAKYFRPWPKRLMRRWLDDHL